ncbi:MAG: ABC transporter ATP-binding protein [Symbiobacteriia bacterium]
MGEPLFSLRSVTKWRPDEAGHPVAVLSQVSLDLQPGVITTLVGPSGAGKSTLLHLLNRLEDPDEGSILYRGEDLRRQEVVRLRRAVGLVLQAPVMLPGTVLYNIAAGPRLRGETLAPARATELLQLVGLVPSFLGREARSLSGGEQQRVSLARALANEPEVLLLDEVTSSLDPAAAHDVEALIVDLARRLSLTAIWVTHDLGQAERAGDRLVLLVAGRVVEEAGTAAFFVGPVTEAGRHFLASAREGAQ